MPKISIQPNHISESGKGSVALDNPVLRNLLIQKHEAALDWLKTRVAPVDPSKISIDDNGKVVVSDAHFAKVLMERQKDQIARGVMGDTACSNGSC